MNLLSIISWTGWTKEDWREFLSRFNPKNLFTWTGWSEEDWFDLTMSWHKVILGGLIGGVILSVMFFA